MLDINELKKERGYEHVWGTVYEFRFIFATIETLNGKGIRFLIDEVTGEEYFKEKGYNLIIYHLELNCLEVSKWGLTYELDIDLEATKLKGIKRFY